MANYRAIVRQFPGASHYLRHATKWVRRGDVFAYQPLLKTPSFSTDVFGFRHTQFEGRDLSIKDIQAHPRVGLVLGSSHVFGFGLSNNSETLPSCLSERLGYPFFGIAFPEADTRTLHAAFARVAQQLADRIQQVFLLTGGDPTRFCYTGLSDPLFGPPLLPLDSQGAMPEGLESEDAIAPDESRQVANLLQFSFFWTLRCVGLARLARIPLTLVDDVTFFEKSAPDHLEQICQLGMSEDPRQRKRFKVHARHKDTFYAERRKFVSRQGLPVAQFPHPDNLLYIDEFHYRAETQRLIAQTLAEQVS
jgi:hypothetical protein